jgi:hypothetical protein
VDDAALYVRAKDFSTTIDTGDVVVKHQNEEAQNNSDDVPF